MGVLLSHAAVGKSLSEKSGQCLRELLFVGKSDRGIQRKVRICLELAATLHAFIPAVVKRVARRWPDAAGEAPSRQAIRALLQSAPQQFLRPL